MSYRRFEFPRIDVAIDVEGTRLDYSFYLKDMRTLCRELPGPISVTSAVCREGDITLEGKRHHIVLMDFNSNGRFDDKTTIARQIRMASG